ncbi:MAG: hypothetical protein AAGA37_21560 [Actinomycetota bacterium]
MKLFRRFRRSAEPLDPAFGQLLGDLSGPVARISAEGVVATLDGSWRVEWGVLAGPEWKRAAEQVAVRQGRVDDAPVYETWMRVAGGDIIQRVGVLNNGSGRALCFEFENASPNAVVVAVAGRGIEQADADLSGVRLDGVCWIRPGVDAGAVVVDPDIWPAVETNPTAATARGEGDAAMLIPLPHRQTLSVMVTIDGDGTMRPSTPSEIAAGWRAVTANALELDVPDVQLDAAWRRVVGDLILAAGSSDPIVAGEAAWWLDLAGLPAEADRARANVLDAADRGDLDAEAAVVALRALASRELRQGEPSGLAQIAGPLAAISGARLDQATARLVARALQTDAPDAAADAAALVDELALDDRATVTPVAAGAERVLGHLFRDADLAGRLEMLPDVPAAWFGQSIDVRGMVTGLGTLSFSVRWHGERPAVLWERIGGPDDALLTCPGLDPSWSTSERAGEALLAAP